jgi:glutamate racemase
MKNEIRKNPIGIIDSGFGGLSIMKEVLKLLPHENIIYFGDNKNCPYGNKTVEEIRTLTSGIVEYLLRHTCKLIVVACNTMTTNAIEYLRGRYQAPFVGIEPAIKVAAKQTETKNIGVLATKGTFIGEKYQKTKETISNDITIHTQIGNGLVEMVESGDISSIRLRNTLYTYLDYFIQNRVDQIVLGCTHYPFLIDYMKEYVKDSIEIINPAPAVAKQVMNKLEELHLLNKEKKRPLLQFFTSNTIFPVNRFIPAIDRYAFTVATDVVPA